MALLSTFGYTKYSSPLLVFLPNLGVTPATKAYHFKKICLLLNSWLACWSKNYQHLLGMLLNLYMLQKSALQNFQTLSTQ